MRLNRMPLHIETEGRGALEVRPHHISSTRNHRRFAALPRHARHERDDVELIRDCSIEMGQAIVAASANYPTCENKIWRTADRFRNDVFNTAFRTKSSTPDATHGHKRLTYISLAQSSG